MIPLPKTHRVVSKPAPIGGLNARDGLMAMPEQDAISLVNMVPDTYGVRARKGFREWAVNFPGDAEIQAILPYFASSMTISGGAFFSTPTAMPGKLFAATKTGIYDITNATDAPASTITLDGDDYSGWFSHTMLSNSAGAFLLACSEDDGYFLYDGLSWARPTLGGGAGQINGRNPADFAFVAMWKRRAMFVERNSTRVWYLPVDQIYGTVTSFDFGPMLKRGGHVAFIANWTLDAGEGIDDFLVIVGSNGDVVIYKGTDPNSASTFAHVGTWNAGQIPVGRRGFTQLGGDLVLVTTEGIMPLSHITRGGAEFLKATGKEYSSKIRPLIGQDMRVSFTERGWQLIVHPSERLLICSEPNFTNAFNQQFAMSTALNEWVIFRDIPIYSMGQTAGYTFAGTRDGRVLLLFTGYFDDVQYGEGTGNGIRCVIQPAYSNFGFPAQQKMFTMVRPTFIATDAPSVTLGINVNYDITPPQGTPTYNSLPVSRWDTALWDEAVWGGQMRSFNEWTTVGALGLTGAITMIVVCVGDTTLVSVDYMFTVGGPL